MSTGDREFELADEQAAQKRYAHAIDAKFSRPVHFEPRLIGRVALANPQPELGGSADFYIGDTRASIDGFDVFSWAAPVACTFFRGTRHDPWCHEVTAVRAFVHGQGQITDFADDFLGDDAPATPFRKRSLSVPAAPRGRALPRPTGHGDAASSPGAAPAATAVGQAGVRAPVRAELLRRQLEAPRTANLAPVLATLQPDQYDLVTASAMDSMIIEGQPGTGKTIIAAHRAAYLVNEATPGDRSLDGNILLVGPTDGYTRHVRGAVGRLTGGTDRIGIFSLPRLMQTILDLHQEPGGPVARSWEDADWHLGTMARSAIHSLKISKKATPTPEDAYECLRRNGIPGRPAATDPDWRAYLNHLPPYREALTARAQLPLLAFIKWEVDKPAAFGAIELVIVDEAQDVTPLEWFLLNAMNEARAWTLLGDLNQRRSDHTLASWRHILDVIGLAANETPVRQLQRGYRSTRPILEYANRLLAKDQRNVVAFQEAGPPPAVESVSPGGLPAALVKHVNRLLAAYPAGTMAVISVDPPTVRASLRAAGWAMARNSHQVWERKGRIVTVLHPDAARGLEFDAVLVAEPADFPQNFGRQGPLYTTLTRPNRELAIIHAKPLPDALRRR
jgi:ATP-dependent DNA helicase UvrD/PcrA